MDSSVVFIKLRQCAPHLIMLIRPTRVHSWNDITIDLAIFAQLTAECRRAYPRQILSPKNCLLAWGDLDLHLIYMVPWAHPSPHAKQHLEWFSHFCTAHSRVSSGMPGHVFPLKLPLHLGQSGPTSNALFPGPSQVHNLSGISIGWATFAQLTAECCQTSVGMPCPLKIAPSYGVTWNLI